MFILYTKMKWNIYRGGHQRLLMNGKYKAYLCVGIDREFWSTFLKTLKHYSIEAQKIMFHNFLETNFTNSINI
jgi:hypothetical protein